ncbi:hypothetical protein [Paenibacillus sp. A14]|uniref:hypothetical protein n=1 Tax=Paenibacillus sp. A14 TaxID=3119820 RepID=UPI002FE2AA8D
MVKQEIIFWRYLWKTQYVLLLLPIILMALAAAIATYDGDLANNLMKLIVFPILLFPAVASLYHIGSIHHRELLLTFPLNNLWLGLIRPAFLGFIYSACFTISLKTVSPYSTEELASAFISSFFYMILAGFFLVLFKSIAIGFVIPMAYLFYGIFTTGTGEGYFYLMQWARPNPDLTLRDCVVVQAIAAIVFSLGTLYFLAKRNKYHWNT